MLVGLTPGQKIVLALTVIALVAGLWVGAGAGKRDGAGGGPEVEYSLSEMAAAPITVHVVGAVNRPGVYTLPTGSRVREAIVAAGDFTSNADRESVNLAAFLDDGEQVRVDSRPAPDAAGPPSTAASPASALPAPARPDSQPVAPTHASPAQPRESIGTASQTDLPEFARTPSPGRVRLNRAGLEELQELPGIGPELAKNIIYHRSTHGPFRSFTDLHDVPGIGSATVEKIRVSATLN
ncbi:MAG: helix-hairpin-helix domain-containing protein [Armatimonadota bacterium]|jgi:competence protein ComEA